MSESKNQTNRYCTNTNRKTSLRKIRLQQNFGRNQTLRDISDPNLIKIDTP